MTTDRDSECSAWRASSSRAAGTRTCPITSRGTSTSCDLSDDGKQLAVVANEDGVGRLHLFDARTGKERPAPKLPPGTVTGIGWHPNGRSLAVTLASARMPADVFVADTRSGRVERWTESEIGGVDLRDLPEPEPIKWRSFDGRELSGLLYRPPARFTGRRPVMVNIHGGPEGQARPSFLGRQQLPPRRARRRDRLPERARLDRLRQDVHQARQRVAARGLREGHRRAARLDHDATRRSTPIASWSAAAATAAT